MNIGRWVYLLVMLMVSQGVAAESLNYFRPGTKWIHEETGCGPEIHSSYVFQWLDDEIEIGGFKAMKMWRQYDGREMWLKTYLRVDGDKVYFLVDKEGTDWRLLYDFSLKPGEGVEVWYFNGVIDDCITPMSGYMVCEEIRPSATDESITEMVMRNYASKARYESAPDDFNRCIWFQGIGSNGDPLYVIWGDDIDGGSLELLLVESEGEVVYRAPGYTGISYVGETPVKVLTSRGELCVVCDNLSSVRVWSAGGVLCGGREGVFANLPRGIYVVQAADRRISVMVP